MQLEDPHFDEFVNALENAFGGPPAVYKLGPGVFYLFCGAKKKNEGEEVNAEKEGVAADGKGDSDEGECVAAQNPANPNSNSDKPMLQMLYYPTTVMNRISKESLEAYFKEQEIPYKNNLNIYHIDEDAWIHRPHWVLSRLKIKAGQAKKIFARNTVVARIDKKRAMEFQKAHHSMVPLPGKFRYGLYHKGDLVSIAVFSTGRTMKFKGDQYRSFELLRTCHKQGLIVVGGLSKLIHYFEEQYHPNDVMTYVDKDWSDGLSFQAIGFEAVEETEPQSFWIDQNHQIRYTAFDLPTEWKEKLLGNMHALTESGIFPKRNSGSIKLVKKNKITTLGGDLNQKL
jgi:hypothetical protein